MATGGPRPGRTMMRTLVVLGVLVLTGIVVALARPASPGGDPVEPAWVDTLPEPAATSDMQEGIAVGLFFEEEGGTWESYLWEAARTGATHVSIVARLAMHDVRATEVRSSPGMTPSDDELRDAIRHAHALGLEVLFFPIVWLEHRETGEWRGRIVTNDLDAWFDSYRDHLVHWAQIADEEGVALFSVGSELGSLERHTDRWLAVIDAVRAEFDGELMYSANWDHYHRTTFWDAVDYIGVTGYYELAPRDGDIPGVDGLVEAWAPVEASLAAVAERHDRPVVITEIGYVSQTDAARYPWNYTLTGDVDLRAQRDLYEAMFRALDGEPWLGGVYVWNWFGDGGVDDDGYTPRGKPAEHVVRHWFGGPP